MWQGEFENDKPYKKSEGQKRPRFFHWLAGQEQVDEIKKTLEKSHPEFKRLLTFPGGRKISKGYFWYRDDGGYDIVIQSDHKRDRFMVTCSGPVSPILNDIFGLIPVNPLKNLDNYEGINY